MGKYKYCYGIESIGDVCDFRDKSKQVASYVAYMLSRTSRMFEYDGLPDTIPARELELQLQLNGFTYITKVEGELYAFYGGLGGVPDAYYRPTIITIANPYLKYNATLDIEKDGVVGWDDSMHWGLKSMFSRYATALVENDLSMWICDVNKRIQSLISAQDDRTYESAKQYLSQVLKGELGIIIEQPFIDGLKSQPYVSSNQMITELVEYQQYLKASWFNDLGLNANYNMKRESINSEEAQMNDDALLPLVDDMLKCREEFVEKVNKMYGTNISVKLGMAWEQKQEEITNPVEEEQPVEDGGETDETE